MNSEDCLTILFVPLSATGHIYSSLAVADALKKRGHKVIFATERSWKGKIEKFGFEEYIYDERQEETNAVDKWSQIIASQTEIFKKSPLEQVLCHPETYAPFFEIIEYVNPQFEKMIDVVKPNVIIEDFLVLPSSLVTRNIPLIRLFSSSPLYAFNDERLPPPFLGLPTNDNTEWHRMRKLTSDAFGWKNKKIYEMLEKENKLFIKTSIDREPLSRNLNIYIYPKTLVCEYIKLSPLDNTWVGIDHSIRQQTSSFEIPEKLKKREGKLIYFSLGSMGSAIDELMQRFLNFFATSTHNFIVSLGVNYEKYAQLPENVWGDAFVPQLAVLPQVDLVLTHGGNNSFLESLYFGKPVIVLPLFDDQMDNAQRAVEANIGLRFSPFEVQQNELHDAIEKVLNSKEIQENARRIGDEMRKSKSMENCVERIEYFTRNSMFPTV